MILKRLSSAIRDGDNICAVVRETASNQDGSTPTITAPSFYAQRNLIEECYARAGLDPLDTTFVEAHGTGTRVGDPAEARAIGESMGKGRAKPLYVASVKTNLGHTEAASGLAALIKVTLALQNRQIPPSLNFEKANPEIDLDGLRLTVPTKLEPWTSSNGPLRASINNFGYGGTNTHVIIEEAPLVRAASVAAGRIPSRQLFFVSAHNKETTQQMATNLKDYLRLSKETLSDASAFGNLAFTLAERRTRFPWTIAVSASGVDDLASRLSEGTVQPVQRLEKPPRVGFAFNGQGAQWFAMGRELYMAYEVYKETIDDCDRIIQSFGSDWSLVEELGRSKDSSRVNQVAFSMPLSCAVQLALVRLLHSFGIVPTAVTGHSSGEVAAAFAAGALSLHDAMACTYFRGLITARHLAATSNEAKNPAGGMLAVGLGSTEAQPYVDATTAGKVVIACENSPSSVTLSGDMAGIEELESKFLSENIFARKLVVQSAFHSHHMVPLEKDYASALNQHMAKQRSFEENVTFVSPVTGTRVQDAHQLGPAHWVRNMISPVLFCDSFRNMVATEQPDGTMIQNVDVVLEVGPHSALAGPIRQNLQAVKGLSVAYGSCLERGQDAVLTIQTLVGLLSSKGYPVDNSRVNAPGGQEALEFVPGLPSYPWNHNQRFWHEPRVSIEHRFRPNPHHDLLGVRLPGTSDYSPIWRQMIRTGEVSHQWMKNLF